MNLAHKLHAAPVMQLCFPGNRRSHRCSPRSRESPALTTSPGKDILPANSCDSCAAKSPRPALQAICRCGQITVEPARHSTSSPVISAGSRELRRIRTRPESCSSSLSSPASVTLPGLRRRARDESGEHDLCSPGAAGRGRATAPQREQTANRAPHRGDNAIGTAAIAAFLDLDKTARPPPVLHRGSISKGLCSWYGCTRLRGPFRRSDSTSRGSSSRPRVPITRSTSPSSATSPGEPWHNNPRPPQRHRVEAPGAADHFARFMVALPVTLQVLIT